MSDTEGIEIHVSDGSRLTGTHVAQTEQEAFRFMRRIVRHMAKAFPAEQQEPGRWYRTANRIGYEQGRFRATNSIAFRNIQIPRSFVKEGMRFTAAWASLPEPIIWTAKCVTEHDVYIVSDRMSLGFPRDHLLKKEDFLRQYVPVSAVYR